MSFLLFILISFLLPSCVFSHKQLSQKTIDHNNQLYAKKNPDINQNWTMSNYEIAHTHPKAKKTTIQSFGNTFNIFYNENSPLEAINPNFPTIHITTNAQHNGWLHVIRTDSHTPKYREFIDSFDDNHELYPFYAKGDWGFYDQPLWSATYYRKPVSYWHANAYAVFINEETKNIKCIGGISWGYTLPKKSWGPKMILPSALNHQDWLTDQKIFIPVLNKQGYSIH